MENLWKLMPLLLIFGAFIVCMLLIDRKSLNIKSKTVGDGQHGSASFATPKEIDAAFQRVRYEPQVWRRKPPCDLPQGIIIGCNMMKFGKKKTVTAIVEKGDVHALMIGAAGVGKTAKFLYPNLEYCCASGMSFVTTDTKGDLLRSYAPIAKKYYGYDISVLDLRNPTQSDGFNILQKDVEAEILFQPEEQKEEKGEERHIISVFKLIQDLLGPSEVKGKSQFKLLMERLPEEHKARWLSGAALNTSDQAMASVLSTALSRLNAFLDSEIEQLLCFETKINTEKFCRNKSAVFLIMPEEDDSKYFLISLIVQQLYREMLSIADEMGGKLPNRVMFFLDEFGTLPAIQSAEMMFSASRSRRISFVPIIQSLAQLEKNYGKEGADIIIDNCQVCIYGGFAPNSEAANVLSKTLGDRTVMTGSISQGRDKSKSLQMTGRPLMTPDELKIMPKDTFIVTRTGVKPMKTKLKLFFEWGIELNETYPMRQAVVRKVHYANKKTIEEAIAKKYGLPQNPLQQPVKRPMQEQDKPLCNISKTMKGVEKSYD